MGLDGSVAALVTETLCTALRPFECCPIASENCTLLIEMAKFAALSSEKTVHLDLKGFNFPLKRKIKKSSYGECDKILKNNEVEVEVEDKSSRYVEEDMADEEEDNSREGEEEDLRVDTVQHRRYEAPMPSKVSKGSHLNYPFSVYPDREPSRFLSSGSDSIFLGGAGVTGLLNLEGSPRMQKGGPPLLRSEKGRTSLFFPPPPADHVHDTHVHASDHADVHNILKGQEQGQGQSFSDKVDSDYLTVADLPNYCVPDTFERGSAEKPVIIDKRTEDQVQFSLIGSNKDPFCTSSFHSISIEEKEKKKEMEGGKPKTKIKEFVAGKAPLNHGSIDADDSSDTGSIDVDMEDIITSSNARSSGRTVSFDETASSADADNLDHERIHSPRFDPPLSPPPHHTDTDEVPTNGHALEPSPYSADTSDRVIVFSTVDPVKATNQPQPLSLSPTRTGFKSTIPHTASHSPSQSDKYATQMKLRARAEKELMKRGNHVAFEAERENENNDDNSIDVEDEAQLFRNSLLQNSDTNMNTTINSNSSHYYDSSSAYSVSALSQSQPTATSTSHSHSQSDSRTNEEIENADDYGVGSEDVAMGMDRDRVKEASYELCDDDEHGILDGISHVHPQSHPAYGSPPLNADGSLNLTSNPSLNKMLTRSLEDVAKIYSSSLSGTGTGTGLGAGAGAAVGEYGAQFSRNKSDEQPPLPQSRSLSKSSSMNDLDRKREIVERERASLRRSYEELGGRGSGSGSDSGDDDEDRKLLTEHREGHHAQYDSLSGEGTSALGGDGDGDSGLLFQGSSTHSDVMKHKQKGLHVHIKDIEVEEIPDHVFSPSKIEKDIPRDLHAGELDDIYGNHGSASQASPKKAKSRRKKKGKKDVEKEVVHRALHAPKHITGKFTDIRASQDFRTGIYRSAVRDPISSSPPPPPPNPNPNRRFSEVHRKVPETSSSLSPLRTRNPISKITVAGSSGPYGLVRHSIGGPTASIKSKPALPLRGKSPLTRPATATATATASRKLNAPPAPGKGKGKGKASSSSGSAAVVSAPVLENAFDGDVTRKSVAVHVPSAIFAALSPLSQNYSDEEVEAEVEAQTEAEDEVDERNARKVHNKPSHLLSPHFTQHNTSENVYQTHQDQSVRPSRGLVRCPSPYSPAAASRSGSPILRTRSKSREAYKKELNVGGAPRREEFESEVETEDFSSDSSDSAGSPQSQYHLKDGNLRPKSAKGRRRSSENSSPHPSPSVLDPFRYQGNAQTTHKGEEQECEEKHQNYFYRSAQQSATPHVEAPISSMYSPNMNISKQAGRDREREKDQLESFSSLHFSRDAAFSQSLREVISQSVEGSFKKLLGPSFKSLLLGHATAQSVGRVIRKKSLSPASPSHMSRDRVFLRGRESPEGPFSHHRDRRGSHEPTASQQQQQQQQRQRVRQARYLLEDKALGELDGIQSSDDHWTANGHLKATKTSRGASSSARILKDDVIRASSSSTVAVAARPLHNYNYRTALDRPSPSDAVAVSSPSPHKPLAKCFPTSASATTSASASASAGALRGCLKKSKGKTKRKETIEYV